MGDLVKHHSKRGFVGSFQDKPHQKVNPHHLNKNIDKNEDMKPLA